MRSFNTHLQVRLRKTTHLNISSLKSMVAKMAIVVVAILLATANVSAPSAIAASGKANFKWIYTYTDAQQTGLLTVEIYDQTCSYQEETYHFPSTCSSKNGYVACSVNIQEAVNQAYDDLGHEQNAPAAQGYQGIFAEAIGQWTSYPQKGHATLVEHPSLTFDLESSSRETRFMTSWSGTSASSEFYDIQLNHKTSMRTEFGADEKSQTSGFTHTVDGQILNVESASQSLVPFQLNDTVFEIYEPSEFDLDTFIVDPGKCGFG